MPEAGVGLFDVDLGHLHRLGAGSDGARRLTELFEVDRSTGEGNGIAVLVPSCNQGCRVAGVVVGSFRVVHRCDVPARPVR